MIWVDFVIVGIIALSALVSVMRGFMREALSLATWILAFWVGLSYASPVSVYLEPYVSVPSLRLGIGFGALFLAVLLVGGLLSFLVAKLVEETGLSGTDRLLGVVFGIGRGVVIVALLVLLAGLTPIPSDPWWKQSVLIGHFEELAIRIRAFLPPDVASNIVYP